MRWLLEWLDGIALWWLSRRAFHNEGIGVWGDPEDPDAMIFPLSKVEDEPKRTGGPDYGDLA